MVVMEVDMVSGWSAKFSEIEALANSVDYEIQRVERYINLLVSFSI